MRIAHRAQDCAHASDWFEYRGLSRTSAGYQIGMATDIFSKRRDDQIGTMCQRGLVEERRPAHPNDSASRRQGEEVRFATDSPVEEAVTSELVSATKFPVIQGKIHGILLV